MIHPSLVPFESCLVCWVPNALTYTQVAEFIPVMLCPNDHWVCRVCFLAGRMAECPLCRGGRFEPNYPRRPRILPEALWYALLRRMECRRLRRRVEVLQFENLLLQGERLLNDRALLVQQRERGRLTEDVLMSQERCGELERIVRTQDQKIRELQEQLDEEPEI